MTIARTARTSIFVALAVAVVALAAACTGSPAGGDPPTIELYTPETGAITHHWIAISGVATGRLDRVEVQIDDGSQLEARGTEEWSYTFDASTIPDGSHTVRATATDRRGRTAQTLPLSFISLAHAATGQQFLAGSVTHNTTQLIPGATVSLYDDPAKTTIADLNGHYAVAGLDPGTSKILHGSSSGYFDTYLYRTSGASSGYDINIPLFGQDTIDFLGGGTGATWTSGTGFVLGFLIDSAGGASVGTSVQLDPPPPPGSGPFYLGADGTPDPALTASSTSGIFYVFNVPPGALAFTASNGTASFFTTTSVSVSGAVTLLAAQQFPGP